MRLLLDTHAFLWWVDDDRRLGPDARAAISNADNVVWVSAATAWEIAIKRAKGKLTAGDIEASITENRFRPLAIEVVHGIAAGNLPPHHRDPFDRVLIAQAQHESLSVVTDDRAFDAYDIEIVPAGR